MPGFNGTGPFGNGPMTGRGLGPCGQGRAAGYGYGRGMGFGRRGAGFGFGARFFGAYERPYEPTLEELRQQRDLLDKQIESMQQQVNNNL
ncbi:MAG: DUF5320 domain-containing protein [Spirochaetes bacterium]|nr:DUF5320 domain-containing protein [Spirochaetota bacterium]MBN2770153.1 DUF5320 domain-containing protein [Spirochaetota bacterium]